MSMKRRKDRDPIALGNIPGLIGGLFELTRQIRETSRNVVSNRDDCLYLAEHIEEIVGFISELQDIALSNEQFRKIILGLYDTMIKCLEFMKIFLDASKLRQILYNNHYKRQFAYFNQRLDQYKSRLIFALNVGNYAAKPRKVEPPPISKPSPPSSKPSLPSRNKQYGYKHISQSRYSQGISHNKHFMKQLSVHNSHRHRHVHSLNNQMTNPFHLIYNYHDR